MQNHIAKTMGISISVLLWTAHMLFMPLSSNGYAICTLLSVMMVGAGFYFDARNRKFVPLATSDEPGQVNPTLVYAMHHVLNNFISGMELMRMEAQSCKDFDRKVLELYDESLRDSVYKIQMIAEANDFTQASIWQQLYPDIANPRKELTQKYNGEATA